MSLIQCKNDPGKSRGSTRAAREASKSGTPRYLKSSRDTHEHEADRAADRVLSGGSAGTNMYSTATPRASAGGEPLKPEIRRDMERGFGADFSGVRVHTGGGAASDAASKSALAYTKGQDISFAAGQYSPESWGGQRLLAHELAHVVQQSGGGDSLSPATEGSVQKYGHKSSCPEEFLKSHVWPGDALAKQMIPHALNAMCAAEFGNSTPRNRKAAAMMASVFGADWRGKSPEIYKNLWLLRSALSGGDYMYDCISGCDSEDEGDKETEYGNTVVDGGTGGDINICYKNFADKTVDWFATVVIHEMGHLMVGLEHGEDEESGTCGGDTSDAHCYALLASNLWTYVNPSYSTTIGDLCHGGGGDYAQRPANWD